MTWALLALSVMNLSLIALLAFGERRFSAERQHLTHIAIARHAHDVVALEKPRPRPADDERTEDEGLQVGLGG